MNPSGSEFTLRVAICDLVERLKRMQHKCTYLEECRNQLVKEVIRLRLQNEWLARQINDSPEISSLPQNIQCFCNQQNLVNNTSLHTAHCHLNGQELNNSSNDSHVSNRSSETKHSNKDESIHLINFLKELDREGLENRQDSIRQLTIQMLKDLDKEMKTGQLKLDLINFIKNNLSVNEDDELIQLEENNSEQSNKNDPQTNMISTDYEAFNNNSDYYSNSHNLNVPLEDLQYSQNAIKEKNEIDTLLVRDKCSNSIVTNKPSAQLKTNIEKKDSNNSPALFNSIDLVAQENQFISIINSVKSDLKYLHQEVLASTDKLNKIKTRQLRHFFQKQINLDSSLVKHQ